MITRRRIRCGLLWAGLGCGAVGAFVYIVSLLVGITYIAPTRTFSVAQGALSTSWGHEPRYEYRPLSNAPSLAQRIETLDREEVWNFKPPHARASPLIRVPEEDWERVLQSFDYYAAGQVMQVDIHEPDDWPVEGGRVQGGRAPSPRETLWIIRTTEGWMQAAQLPAGGEWQIAGGSSEQYRSWYWYPRLKEAGSGPGLITLPAWMLVLMGLISAYFLLPPDTPPGTCRRCGFDLSRTPPLPGDSTRRQRIRCPECGMINHRRARSEAVPLPSGPDSPPAAPEAKRPLARGQQD